MAYSHLKFDVALGNGTLGIYTLAGCDALINPINKVICIKNVHF